MKRFLALLSFLVVLPPTLLSPVDTSTVVSSKLEWEIPAYTLYSGGSPYMIQVDDQQSFVNPEKNNIYLTRNYYTPQLNPGIWYWRVKAKDSSGSWSNWSSIWSFTLIEPTPSPTPTPTPSPTPSPTPTKTPSPSPTATPKKTATPTPTATSTPSPTLTPSSTPSPKSTPTPSSRKTEINYRIASVAAVSTESSTPASGSSQIDVKNQKQTNPFLWIGLVFILMGAGSVGYIYLKQNEKIHFPFRR